MRRSLDPETKVVLSAVRRRTALRRRRRDRTAAMRIRTDSSASSASLADYLQRCGCIVSVIDRRVIEATARPQSFQAPYADVELEGYLQVWEAMHPDALVERLTPVGRK
jgi:hypothetical protein